MKIFHSFKTKNIKERHQFPHFILPNHDEHYRGFNPLSGMQQVEESSWSFIHRIKDGKLCSVIELGKVREWRSIGGNDVPNGRFCFWKILSTGVPSETFGIYAVQKIKEGISCRYQHHSMHMISMLLNYIYNQLENSNFHVH